MHENENSGQIVDAAYRIHRKVGPGLFESVYERILRYELERLGLLVLAQHPVPVIYDAIRIDEAFRADLIVENKVIVELKSVEAIHPVQKMQVRPADTTGLDRDADLVLAYGRQRDLFEVKRSARGRKSHRFHRPLL